MTMIPKARDFSRRLKLTLFLGAVAGIGLALYFMNASNPAGLLDGGKSTAETSDSSQAITRIAALQASPPPVMLLDNWAVLLHGKAYPILQHGDKFYASVNGQQIPLKAGTLLTKNGQRYRYTGHGMVPITAPSPTING